ncbi:MAG: hypothetical protein WBU92_01225, partial [Candidatus Dormiibacterota bacterium]
MTPLALAFDALGALAVFGAIAAVGLARTRSREADLDDRVRRFAEAGAGLPINVPQGREGDA